MSYSTYTASQADVFWAKVIDLIPSLEDELNAVVQNAYDAGYEAGEEANDD